MSLAPGTRLGSYDVTAQIGAGGMGQVYRARDTKLNRDVAIKILPDLFANDPDRLARFTREAQVLASLNHPNIAAIYGIEESNGLRALVMELVEGEDLSTLIMNGHPEAESVSSRSRDTDARRAPGGGAPGELKNVGIPLADALSIAKQIAEALEAAHEQGVIHRDLKPANIKVRPDGTVKVLDFGLAKAMDPVAGASGSSASASMSPTITSPAMTQMGMILGTAAYMSPEQAKGRSVDRRADVWAFGAVFYEMLTGERAFAGEDISDTLASVLKTDPDWARLPADVPPRIRQVLRACLQKNPKQRIGDMQDVRLALDGAFETAAPVAPAAVPIVSRTRERMAWAALGVMTLAALALAAFAYLGRAPAEVHAMRFFVSPPDGWSLTTANVAGASGSASPAPLAVSPDGSRIAFLAAAANGRRRLWVRALDALTPRELPGTDGAFSPFWSPDSRSLGFFADGKLKKIDVSGGPAVPLCDSAGSVGGTWSPDGVIVFSPGITSALEKVSASGGVPAAATVLDKGETYHGRPSFLPDGRHFLYRVGNGGIYVASLDSPARTLLIQSPDGSNVLYSQGYLLFLRETTLMAQPFDLARLTLTGEPVPIAEQVQRSTTTQPNGFFSASATGVLVYQTGSATASDRELTWFDRAGKRLGTVEKPGQYNTVALSPDGTRVAVSRFDPQGAGRAGQTGNIDLWSHEFARNTSTRLTFDPASDQMAVWSRDGNRIVWSSNRDGNYNLYRKVSNGAGADETLFASSDPKFACDWSPDGRFLLYAVVKARLELWVFPLTGGDKTPTPYLQTDFSLSQARFSPDGHYVAYTSNASGANEVYVQPFPVAADGKWMLSQGGGSQPRWRRDGTELFYIAPDSSLMVVPVATTPAFAPGVPKALFATTILGGPANVTRYDVTADGQKFLINSALPEMTAGVATPMTVVLNWTAGLKPQGR